MFCEQGLMRATRILSGFNLCREMGVRPSMGTVGDAYDNAMAESFFATLECEVIARRSWKPKTEVRLVVFTRESRAGTTRTGATRP